LCCSFLQRFDRGRALAALTAARGAVEERDREARAAREDRDFARRDAHAPKLGRDEQRAELRDEEQVTIGVGKARVGHVGGGGVEVDGRAGAHRGGAGAADGREAADEIDARGGERLRAPAELVRRRRAGGEVGGQPRVRRLERRKGRVRDRGQNAVEPGAAVGRARGGEGAAR
jgi:hypothetical protein